MSKSLYKRIVDTPETLTKWQKYSVMLFGECLLWVVNNLDSYFVARDKKKYENIEIKARINRNRQLRKELRRKNDLKIKIIRESTIDS